MSDARFPRPFGKYTLLRPLARGGMGELYLAATGDLGGAEKLCVIKKLPDALPASGARHSARRLLDEARVMVRLNHVNLVQVFDTGMVDGDLYLALELVAGRDLRAAWNRCADLQARIPVDMALYIVREVARGLAYAHSYGGLHLVHRDVAPPNILCSWQGEVKITDFGLAASRLKSEPTGPGVVFGRLGYLAPEQARGEPADRRSDLYSLGVILWELLTGRPLVDPDREPEEVLRTLRAAERAVEPPSRYAADLPRSLDAVVLRALASRREARFATADEMRQAVSRELVRLAPDIDQGCVVGFLRRLYEDEIEREQAERERLLREELPRLRGSATPPAAAEEPAPAVDDVPTPAQARKRLAQIVDGRYRLDRLIGLGGMGAVYEAEHVAIRKKVALKVLHRQFSRQADLVARFRREAQAASRIGHPNIIDVTDFGYTKDGCAYLVMEYLSGTDLGAVLERRGRLGQARSLHIALQLVRALAAAHAAGVIHRDLKPENIFLVDPEGDENSGGESPFRTRERDVVKVLDFGIATRAAASAPIRLTSPGLTVGTPEYMPPEQAAGLPVDGRADVYAVGTLLYEMLTGQLPYAGSDVEELLRRKSLAEPTPPRLVEPDLSTRLEQIVLRCLKRDPADRPQSMDELLRELLVAQAELAPVMPQVRVGPERLDVQAASDPTMALGDGQKAEGSGPAALAASAGAPEPEPPRPEAPPQPEDPSPSLSSRATADATVELPPRPVEVPPAPVPSPPSPPKAPPSVAPPLPARAPPLPASEGRVSARSTERRAPNLVNSRRDYAELRTPTWHFYVGAPICVVLLVFLGYSAARSVSRHQEAAYRIPEPPPPPPAPAPPPDTSVEVLLEWARHAAHNGRYLTPKDDNLLELLERIEALAPRRAEARKLREQTVAAVHRRGLEALQRRELDEALHSFRVLRTLGPELSFPVEDLSHQLQLQARAQNGRKGRERTLRYALAAVDITPESVPARIVLGEVYLGAGQPEQAAAQYERARALGPSAAEEKVLRDGLAKAGALAGKLRRVRSRAAPSPSR